MIMRHSHMTRALALILVMQVSACIFSTRDAQDPADSGNNIVPDRPDKVFVAMEESLEKSKRDANYERVISTSFVFSPTVTDSLDQNFDGTGVFDNWTKQVEMDVLNLLLSDAQKINVTFNPSTLINKNSFVRFRVEYTLDVITNAAPTDTTHYAGVAQFDVRNESGNWRLTFWDEIETVNGLSTWGFLKGVLRLRLNP